MPVLVTGATGFVGAHGASTCAKAERELGCRPRPIGQTISTTTEWYLRPDRPPRSLVAAATG